MTGADLKCARCGCGAVDVAPDYEFPTGGIGFDVSWTCANGHRWFSGVDWSKGYPVFRQAEQYPREAE